MTPTTLAQLYPADTPMSEVSPDFAGMSLRTWRSLKIAEQAEAYRKTRVGAKPEKWQGRAIWTPRDSYGMKSV